MKQLEPLWRLIGTGLSFTIFGLAGLIISVFIFPLIFIFVRNPDTKRHRARRLIGRGFGWFVWIMKSLGVLSYEIRGREHVCAGRNQVIIANHPTLIDVVFLVYLFPLANCVVKEAVTKNPFMRGVAATADYISSDDPVELLGNCVERLKSGASLLLFPEGTRSVHGQALKFKMGAASVAVRAGAEILPVIIKCTQPRFLAKHQPWYKVPPEKPFIFIEVGAPESLENLIPGDLSPRQATRALNTVLLEMFESKMA